MLDRIINILKANKEISDWKIIQILTEANELFLIKDYIDMPRSKKINNINVTVYKDFEADGSKYRGSSSINIHPTMTEKEITGAVKDALFSASFVKNPYYPLPEPSIVGLKPLDGQFHRLPLAEWMPKIKDALYKSDRCQKGYINSAEIFLNKNNNTVVNSRGINITYTDFSGNIEFITSWKDNGEEIELYKELMFSDFEPAVLSTASKEMLEMSREKAATQPTPKLESIPVILLGEPVAELLKHYYKQSDAQSVYQQISTAKPVESIQGEGIQGDKINMLLDPTLNNSPASAPIDADGFVLSSQKIIIDGILQKYWGSTQHCHYLNVEPTGRINNMVFECGSKTIEEMHSEPYLEIAAFSDFNLSPMTGDFAGEIRLGWHYDGNSRVAVSGGSISGNINKQQTNMYFSTEDQQCIAKEFFQTLCYKGPKALMMYNITIAGI
jgi:predicted Zn-dependent protease